MKPEDVGLPPLNPARKSVYEYYKLAFLPDGYPGRVTERGLIHHPIYGTYVIEDYLRQYRLTSDDVFLTAAKRVAEGALARMEPLFHTKAFYYTPEMGLSSIPGKFYSGLTQARYMATFDRLQKASGDDRYLSAAHDALESLMIPVCKGGVLRDFAGGQVIEEWPNEEMPDFTLNGWTTAMDLVADFAISTGSPKAHALIESNMAALRALLPLYDVPEFANSRYRLAGRTLVRIVHRRPGVSVSSGSVIVPGVGSFPFSSDAGSAWRNYQRPDRPLMFNAVLNYATYPEPNRLQFIVDTENADTIDIQIQTGDFDPTSGTPSNRRWVLVGSFQIEKGRNSIDLGIPWRLIPLLAYPTSHTKKIAGRNYNSYHFIHVKNLRKIAKMTGDVLLSEYAKKWQAYIDKWPTMPVYTNANVEFVSSTEGESSR